MVDSEESARLVTNKGNTMNTCPICKKPKKVVKEGYIRAALKARVESYGGKIRAVSWLGRHSAPDVLCLFPNGSKYDERISLDYSDSVLHPFVETKRPGKDATAAQAREHERLRAAGCVVVMVRTLAELDEWLPAL